MLALDVDRVRRVLSVARRASGGPGRDQFLSLGPLLGPLPSLDLDGIGWVIIGEENGLRHRPMELDWIREPRGRVCGSARAVALHAGWRSQTEGRQAAWKSGPRQHRGQSQSLGQLGDGHGGDEAHGAFRATRQ
jgi:protein gp37